MQKILLLLLELRVGNENHVISISPEHLHHIPVVQFCGGPEVPDACLEQDKLELAGCFEDCP